MSNARVRAAVDRDVELARRDLAQSSAEPSSGSVKRPRIREADVIIVGSGVAGLSAAISAAGSGQRVALLSKSAVGRGGSSLWAQGGVAAAVGGALDQAEHARDTLEAGRELCDPEAVERLTGFGTEAIERLLSFGVQFDRAADGSLELGREGGHGRRRVLHAGGDGTGREIMRALRATLEELVVTHENLIVQDDVFVEDLLLARGESGDRVAGVFGTSPSQAAPDRQQTVVWLAPRVLLATGGLGQLFQRTTNPSEVTGDGIAMAARAGALLADMEMVQFHPTTIAESGDAATPAPLSSQPGMEPSASARLLTEALRGEGALLVDEHGARFMTNVHELAELAPRDVVAQTLWQRERDGLVSRLDLRPVARKLSAAGSSLEERFPTAVTQCRTAGFDPFAGAIPVAPAAHYTMGGVWVDESGKTSLPGLWACGEVASSGVHGANRLASNSLLEGVVFGHAVGRTMTATEPTIETKDQATPEPRLWLGGSPLSLALARRRIGSADPELRSRIQRRMWENAGLVRSARGLLELERELAILARFRTAPSGEDRNLLLLGRLVCAAALRRQESRGSHFRSDFPDTDPAQASRHLATAAELLRPPLVAQGQSSLRAHAANGGA